MKNKPLSNEEKKLTWKEKNIQMINESVDLTAHCKAYIDYRPEYYDDIFESAVKSLNISKEGLQENPFFQSIKDEAIGYLKILADRNHVPSMYEYANAISYPRNKTFDKYDEILYYYKSAAESGHLLSMFQYVNYLIVYKEVKEAKEGCLMLFLRSNFIFSQSLEKDNIKEELGNLMNTNPLFESNRQTLIKTIIDLLIYYSKATCEINCERAFENASKMINISNETEKKLNQDIFKCFREKAIHIIENNMNSTTAYKYAMMLKFGEGIPKNLEKAAVYMKKALSDADYFYGYALMLDYGQGIKADKKTAIEYYKKAADRCHVEAMFDYAMNCFTGNVIERNEDMAIQYYRKALKGHEEAKYNLEQLTGEKISFNELSDDQFSSD